MEASLRAREGQGSAQGGWLDRRGDLAIALVLTVLCAGTRFLAFPASFWEWDDLLFARSLHEFNLLSHSPHPPGFPVFVFIARGLNLIVHNDHTALALESLLFASTLGAAVFYLFREIFVDRTVAAAAAILTMFAPSIWIHSGAARSDEPALAVGLICGALVLHGRRSTRVLLIACAIFGLGMGIRVTLLPVIAPILSMVFLKLFSQRRWKLVLGGVSLGVGVGLSWYLPLIWHTGWEEYRNVMHAHSAYWFATDTAFSPGENSDIARRLWRFFVDIWGGPLNALVVYLLSLAGLITLATKRNWAALGWLSLAFLPFMAFTVLLNTPLSAPLYAFGYIPFFTGLAALGVVTIGRRTVGAKRPDVGNLVGLSTVLVLAWIAAVWSYPVVKMLRRTVSPPVQAMHWIDSHLDPARDIIYYSGYFTPHLNYYEPRFKRIQWRTDAFEVPLENLLNPLPPAKRVFALANSSFLGKQASSFRWPPGKAADRLQVVSLGRYFVEQLKDVTTTEDVIYLQGWYPAEKQGDNVWRWMPKNAEVALFMRASSMTLHLRAIVAKPSAESRSQKITFRLDGKALGEVVPEGNQVDYTVQVPAEADAKWSLLSVEAEHSYAAKDLGAASDPRELSLQAIELTWNPSPGAASIAREFRNIVGHGFYNVEEGPPEAFRWAEKRASLNLPHMSTPSQLGVVMHVPEQPDGTRPPVTFAIDGKVVDTFAPPPDIFVKSYHLDAHPGAGVCEVLITTPKAARVPSDSRELAVQIYEVTNTPAFPDLH